MRAAATTLALAAACLTLTLPTLPARGAPGVPCVFYGINPGAPVWQGQVILDAAYAETLAASGARSVRVDFRLDGALAWDAGKLAEYDAIVDAVIAAGLEPSGLLAYEGVAGGQADWNDDADGDGYNDYVGAFADASGVLLAHFEGRIQRWEIWNEPNCWSDPNYASDPQNAGCSYLLPRVFSKMLAEVFVRSQPLFDAGAVSILSGGLFAHDIGGAPSPATDYLAEVYSDGVWDWLQANAGRRYAWDHLGYHLYVDQGIATDGASMLAYLDAVRELAGQYGDEAPFAVTEIGWSTSAVNEEVQAANLTTAMTLLASRPDVAHVVWFSYRDAPAADLYFGLATETDAPKVALGAMQDAAAGCEGQGGGGGGGGSGGSSAAGGVGLPGPSGGGVAPYGSGQKDSACACAAPGASTSARGTTCGLFFALFALLTRRRRTT